MSAPVRIQRRRAKGWVMPAGAVYVGRPTKWGNPFRVGTPDADDCMNCANPAEAVMKYRAEFLFVRSFLRFNRDDVARELRGYDLVCWCRLDQPCHADVLLKVANSMTAAEDWPV